MLACYGPRFTLSIRTLVETAKGEPREGFDIVAHDAESGDSKSVGLMSGGEKTVINEALRRAIALYLAHNSGRRYQTLFFDEADGAPDPDRKRIFVAMKREVCGWTAMSRTFSCRRRRSWRRWPMSSLIGAGLNANGWMTSTRLPVPQAVADDMVPAQAVRKTRPTFGRAQAEPSAHR